jgi:hypothetical protein
MPAVTVDDQLTLLRVHKLSSGSTTLRPARVCWKVYTRAAVVDERRPLERIVTTTLPDEVRPIRAAGLAMGNQSCF